MNYFSLLREIFNFITKTLVDSSKESIYSVGVIYTNEPKKSNFYINNSQVFANTKLN